MTLALKYGDKPSSTQEAFEFLSTKIGLVLLILGAMHFFNVFNFAKIRRKSKRNGSHDALPMPPLPQLDPAERAARGGF